MTEYVLGIDAGGTHTDAVLCGPEGLVAAAKTVTCHDDLPSSVAEVLRRLREQPAVRDGMFERIRRVTLGATLAVNAIVQDKADRVGLALSAGPGLAPERFALGGHVCVAPGGLDHRGTEVTSLATEALASACARWKAEGVRAVACVGKFSPRNPAHENAMRDVAARACGLPVTCGHALSGQLNFPRRIATAYYNAAVARLHAAFLDAVEGELARAGISAPVRLLKADGGAVPAALSRREPVQSILSGPAASVMGVMALAPVEEDECSLLMDMGGTTTDLAVFVDGSPVVDRDGMLLGGRRTLVRALASLSIGVGGDSLLNLVEDGVRVGPLREGPACAFGGARPTLLDALNVLDAETPGSPLSGDAAASRRALEALAAEAGRPCEELARQAVADALRQIGEAADRLLRGCNERPVYTLAALKGMRTLRPGRVWLVGGPADRMRQRLAQFLRLPVDCPPHADVANAVGAALTLPTATLDVYADTGRGLLRAPALDHEERLPASARLQQVEARALELLRAHLAENGAEGAVVEVLEADSFATLDDGGYGARDMRVSCQVVPGIAGRLTGTAEDGAWN